MNKLLLFSALAATLAAPLALADDALRGAQVTLRNAGYYSGPVDGELNADTKAALRRYQIRNQLEPSGELTTETAAVLAKESGQGSATAAASAPAPAPAPEAAPVPSAPMPAAPAPLPPPPDDPAYAALFARSPYQNAARELQFRTTRDAQVQLGRKGFYRGAPDGQPSPEMQEALGRFQASRGLPRTGRLDIDTLAEMHLLPVAKLPRPRRAPVPYDAPAPTGIPGAVRGVPVD